MAEVIGQIESLKKLRKELNDRGIDRFNSIKEINVFNKNYTSDVNNSKISAEKELDDYISYLKRAIDSNKKILEWKEEELIKKVKEQIRINNNRINTLNKKSAENIFYRSFYYLPIKNLKRKNTTFLRKINHKKFNSTQGLVRQLKLDSSELEYYLSNREDEVLRRHESRLEELYRIKKNVDELYPVIAGAIGESLVVKEVEKLSDDFILINDYTLHLESPMFYNDELIFNIQVDHLLVSKAGIFILETKNWSKESVEKLDLRSPVEQIRRSSYVLFTMLNEALEKGEVVLDEHHWGDRKIRVSNLIVMINNKPKKDFQFVTIKKLSELNSYLSYFKPIYEDHELKSILHYLMKRINE